MRFPKKIVLASFLLLSTTSAFAVDTAELIVTGTIRPAACTPTFTGGGTVAYGDIPIASLSATETTKLAEKTISYTITCDAPISLGYDMLDNRSDTEVLARGQFSATVFGLGLQGSARVGGYTIETDLPSLTGDGVAV